jgi:PAS domain S-box-containing protein
VSDVQRTEELLQESLANWYSLVHNAPDAILTIEETGRIAFVNKQLWGYSVSALVGTNLLDRIPEKERSKVLWCLGQAFRFNKRSMCEFNGIKGGLDEWYQFSFGVTRYKSKAGTTTTTTTTTTLVVREISDHKRMEQTLRSSGERLRDFAARLEDVREEERTRVAREIHDDLGQALTVLKLDLSWLRRKPRGRVETKSKLEGLIGQVDETIERVRRIASDLRPSVLDNLGLIPAIEWQASEFSKRTGTRVQVQVDVDSLDMSDDASVAVFRVVQEALTNVMRHAKASKVQIGIKRVRYALHVSVTDNGIGMKQNRETDLKSLGIVGMKERISRIGGEFKFLPNWVKELGSRS